MARKPFFGSGPAPQIARMDMQSATAPGRMYFNALQNFGTAIANSMEKYKAKKEKKEQQETTYTALKRMGIPDEIAKAGSHDPNVISSHFQKEKLAMQSRAITARNKPSASDLREQGEASQKEGALYSMYNTKGKDGKTLMERKFPELAGFFPKGAQEEGMYTQFHGQLMQFDKSESSNVMKAFTEKGGDLTKLSEGDPEQMKNWGLAGGRPSDITNFQTAMASEGGGFTPQDPVAVDFDGDGKPDKYRLQNTKGSFQYEDVPGSSPDRQSVLRQNAGRIAELKTLLRDDSISKGDKQVYRDELEAYGAMTRAYDTDPMSGDSTLNPFFTDFE